MTFPFKTIITGCDLHGPGFIAHGDLWEVGDMWLFNAVGNEAMWEENADREDFHQSPCVVVLDYESNYWERRGVFVFQRDTSLLNEAAKQYIGVAE